MAQNGLPSHALAIRTITGRGMDWRKRSLRMPCRTATLSGPIGDIPSPVGRNRGVECQRPVDGDQYRLGVG